MRCREWYGWHFPEMGKVISDHTAYARVIKHMGFRTEAQTTDFSGILTEEIETEVNSLYKNVVSQHIDTKLFQSKIIFCFRNWDTKLCSG